MDIFFKSQKHEKIFATKSKMTQKHGQDMANKIAKRLGELRAAEVLSIIQLLPGPRLHQLKGNRDNQFAVDLVHPYRLVFEPYNDPMPLKPDGVFDLSKINAILIIEVVNYHD